MTPRPYRLGLRQEAADATFNQIMAAARDLLSAGDGASAFTVGAVAKEANVARMTVYNRFQSKRGLLEALFDDIATRGQMGRMSSVFSQSHSLDALDRLIDTFAEFWSSDRLVIRRIRALGALDPEIDKALHARDERRLHLVGIVLDRVSREHGSPVPEDFGDVANVIHTLTGFEFLDSLAGSSRSPQSVVPMVKKLARASLGLA